MAYLQSRLLSFSHVLRGVTQNAQRQKIEHWKQNKEYSYLCTSPGFGYHKIMVERIMGIIEN